MTKENIDLNLPVATPLGAGVLVNRDRGMAIISLLRHEYVLSSSEDLMFVAVPEDSLSRYRPSSANAFIDGSPRVPCGTILLLRKITAEPDTRDASDWMLCRLVSVRLREHASPYATVATETKIDMKVDDVSRLFVPSIDGPAAP